MMLSVWPLFKERRRSLSPVIPKRLLLLFLAATLALAEAEVSSDGKVTVLFMASPHFQSLFTIVELALASSAITSSPTKDESALLSISLSKTSWRWLRSCRPVDARQAMFVGLARGGPCWLDEGALPGVGVGGLDSSPASVIARSRLFNPVAPTPGTTGAEALDVGPLAVEGCVPPASSMSNSAHSHVMRYLELSV